MKIMTQPFGVGPINHSDRPLELGITEGIGECLVRLPGEQERGGENGMEQCFIAAGKSWPDPFALSHSSPI